MARWMLLTVVVAVEDDTDDDVTAHNVGHVLDEWTIPGVIRVQSVGVVQTPDE